MTEKPSSLAGALRENLIQAYLDYLNAYLTLDKFAEHYDMTRMQAASVLDLGRVLREKDIKRAKGDFSDD